MQTLATALLLHRTPDGCHHDWLIEDAAQPDPRTARLWTARVALPSRDWARAGRFHLTPLPPHRRLYLGYQGPISGGRGSVQRVDEGRALCRLWSESRIALDVSMRRVSARIELTRLSDEIWTAGVREKILGSGRSGG